MIRKGINAKLVKNNKVYGLIQAWTKESDKSIIIGWSATKDDRFFDFEKSEINAYKRAGEDMYIPDSLKRDMQRFINRCKIYYKDGVLPSWAGNYA